MGKKYDVVANLGKYTDNQGNEKYRTQNIGAVFENDKGYLSLKLETVPIGNEWSGWCNLYELRAKEEDYKKAREAIDHQAPLDDSQDIPW